jgi:hypothetical protein
VITVSAMVILIGVWPVAGNDAELAAGGDAVAADSRDWPRDPGLVGASPPGAGPRGIAQAAVTIVASSSRSSGSSSGPHGRLAGQRAAEGSVRIIAVAVPEVELWLGAQGSAT